MPKAIDRRKFLASSAAVGAGTLVASCQTGGATMSSTTKPPIVLVHGAWHGAWCWRRVIPRLQAAGHEVFVPTLTGLADKAHLLSRSVNLDTHIQDVVGLLEAEELSNVVLVGHSYAGTVITGVTDRARARLRSLVFVDAFLLENGQAMIDLVAPARQEGMRKAGEANGFIDAPPATLFGLTKDSPDMAWVTRRMTRQPYATISQPITLKSPGGTRVGEGLPRTYLYCSTPATGSFDQFAAKLRTDAAWRFHEFKTGHDCMVTEPAETARLILSGA
jgi:pimeloyl-ACP methyl ester carboxylesterase